MSGSAGAQHLPDLVTPEVLRVCADPANMPFSNRKGEGFENKIAAILAEELKVPLRHYWLPQGPGFVRNTLGAGLCDLIIGYTAGADPVQNSNPYYRSVFSMLVKRGGPFEGVRELADPRLQQARVGVIAGTPPIDHLTELKLLDQIRTYSLIVDRRYSSPADAMVADLTAGEIDVGILWGPTAGFFAKQRPAELALVPLLQEKGRPSLVYRITLGHRANELDWKRTLNTVLRRRQADITRVLQDYGVPLLDEDDKLIPPPAGEGTRP
jgi:mxaJ protein